MTNPFAPYLTRWQLTPDGAAIHTHSSDLLPVIFEHKAAMLKLARSAEEQTGNALMVWLNGNGAARVYAHDGPALLLERLNAWPSLAEMALNGRDDEATRILCQVVARLHHPRLTPPPELPTLRRWFRSLEQVAPRGGNWQQSWEVARDLLEHPQEITALHGDIHHGNVMHSDREWLAIDPKGILGERGYDYANIFCNPSTDWALTPGRLAQQIDVVAGAAALEPQRLRCWVAAYAGLSAAWHLEEGEAEAAAQTLELAALALSERE